MIGTEKQVAWAESIKASMLADIDYTRTGADGYAVLEESIISRVFGRDYYEAAKKEAVANIPVKDEYGKRIPGNTGKRLAAKRELATTLVSEAEKIIRAQYNSEWFIARR